MGASSGISFLTKWRLMMDDLKVERSFRVVYPFKFSLDFNEQLRL